MLRALWFLLKVSLLVAALIWVSRQDAQWIDISGIKVNGERYEVEVQAYFLAFLAVVFLYVITRLDRIWRTFFSLPKMYRRYRQAVRHETGYRTLTSGLVAIAAGDARAADRHSRKAERMLPHAPLTKLLTAQTALLHGDAAKARRHFADLLDDAGAAFFGLRGLLHEMLTEGNYREALDLARHADRLQPKSHWVVRTLFDMEVRNREWLKAERTLRKAEKLGIFDAPAARGHRQAIWTAMAQDAEKTGEKMAAGRMAESALALDPGFTPAALLAARLQEGRGKRRAAFKTLEAAWTKSPHPALAALWMAWAPAPRKSKSVYDGGRDVYGWAKRLALLNAQNRESDRLLGAAALKGRLWKEARQHLAAAADYRGLALLEREESGNEAKAREWLEKAAEALPDARWICRSCGHAAEDWNALCPHCGHFDTTAWLIPGHDTHVPQKALHGPVHDVLSPPRAHHA